MTNWLPDLSGLSGPKYKAIADSIARDIADGLLAEDDQLPTHRDLAWRLGVTIGTVSRAYALAQSWGLIAGEVGRGTRVLPAGGRSAPAGREEASPVPTFFPASDRHTIEMSRNYPADEHTGRILADGLRKLANPATLAQMGGYHPPNGTPAQREAGARWLEFCGVQADPARVVVVNGCQHALWVALAALMEPGGTMMTEALTWPGAVNLAGTQGLTVQSLAMDDHGLRPDAFEEACREGRSRLLYTVPTMQNPTAAIMPEARRRDIAAIARANGVTILEDNVFGFLAADAPPSFLEIAPDLTVHATSLSKAVTPALRAGYLVGPDALIPRFASIIQSTTIMPPMLGAQLSAELVMSGAVADAATRQREIAADRLQLAKRILGSNMPATHSNASQIWLKLPPQWDGRSFAAEAMARGVAVSQGSAFCAQRPADDIPAVRVCLCPEPDRNRVEKGLGIVAALLDSHPAAGTPIV